jgi:hypothetical protein
MHDFCISVLYVILLMRKTCISSPPWLLHGSIGTAFAFHIISYRVTEEKVVTSASCSSFILDMT